MSKAKLPQTPEEVILGKRIRLRDLALAKSLLQKVVILAIAVFVLFGVVFGLAPMKGSDMAPSLAAGDLLLYYRLEQNHQRNDVVIIDREGKQYVGRLVAMPGETIEITGDGKIIIDGNSVYEPDIYSATVPGSEEIAYPITLGADEYFLLGDKRNTAKDSRYFGPVRQGEIKGSVLTALKRINP